MKLRARRLLTSTRSVPLQRCVGGTAVFICSLQVCVLSRTAAATELFHPVAQFHARQWPQNTFGASVAISDDTIAAAESYLDAAGDRFGFVNIYKRGTNQVWQKTVDLPMPATNLATVSNVAISGDTLLASIGNRTHVFVEVGAEIWSASDILSPGGPVALDGDIAVSARSIHERDALGMWHTTPLSLPGTSGLTAAVSGNTVIFGIPDSAGGGTANIFQNDGKGNWDQVANLTPDATNSDQLFGASVAIDGDLAIVGATFDSERGPHSGAAYLFRRGADGIWNTAAKITANDAIFGEQFGFSVALSGSTAIVGAIDGFAPGFSARSGSVYVFNDLGNDHWVQVVELNGVANDDKFGWSVGLSGSYLVVGAPSVDDMFPDSGAIYVFEAVVPEPTSVSLIIIFFWIVTGYRRASP